MTATMQGGVPEGAAAMARACAEVLWAGDLACQGLGMRVLEIGPGRAVLEMAVDARMVNGHGMCHGGFIFTLADAAFGYACNTHNEMTVAQHCAVDFLRPAHQGEMLRAEAAEHGRAGRSGIYDVRVTGGDGRVVAEFRGRSRQMGRRFFPTAADGTPQG